MTVVQAELICGETHTMTWIPARLINVRNPRLVEESQLKSKQPGLMRMIWSVEKIYPICQQEVDRIGWREVGVR